MKELSGAIDTFQRTWKNYETTGHARELLEMDGAVPPAALDAGAGREDMFLAPDQFDRIHKYLEGPHPRPVRHWELLLLEPDYIGVKTAMQRVLRVWRGHPSFEDQQQKIRSTTDGH